MTRKRMIIDCETTGLDPARHEIWELAIIEADTGTEHLWRVKPDLVAADPQALAVGRYYERTADMCGDCIRPNRVHDLTFPPTGHDTPEWSAPAVLAGMLARALDNATLIAANPWFDAAFVAAFLSRHGQAATWHYRLRDISSIAWGWLTARESACPPVDASSADFATALGVDTSRFEEHTALGDCRQVQAMLDTMTAVTW